MVLLTLKNLQQQTFQVEIDTSASVRELKEKIEKDRGKDYPAVGQKLIYAGKILQDDNKLESYSMDLNKFLVIMVTKPKTSSPPPEAAAIPAPAAESMDTTSSAAAVATSGVTTTSSTTTTAASSSSTDTTTTTTTTTSSSDSSAAAATDTTSSSAAASSTNTTSNAESLLVMGDEFNKMVDNIMEMGYERREVERALRASFNNPYTAVQYLVDGIPEGLGDADHTEGGGMVGALAAAASVAGSDAAPAAGGAGGDEDPLAFLRSQPQFVQMTQMMRSNPQLLDAFLQQIRTTNPGLLQTIQENQEAFVRMINQPQSSGGGNAGSGGGGAAAPPAVAGGDAPPAAGDDNTTTIMLTPSDREAIDRLRGLGNFPEELVVQAYFACEKNENLAAEFLFSQAWE